MKALKYIPLFCLIMCVAVQVSAQSQPLWGIVFDENTNQRVGKVFIKNERTKENVFNNARGEFEIGAENGDLIIASKEGFYPDTTTYVGQQILMVYLERASIYIPEVRVVARKSPEEIFKQRQEEFSKAYKLADPGSVFSIGPTGAGLSINTLYNLLSKEGKNARRLTKLIQTEYEENVIDAKFTRDLVYHLTGLSGEYLTNFMSNYRPTYFFAQTATPYELSAYIRSKYEIFKLNPNLRFLPKLPDIELEVNN